MLSPINEGFIEPHFTWQIPTVNCHDFEEDWGNGRNSARNYRTGMFQYSKWAQEQFRQLKILMKFSYLWSTIGIWRFFATPIIWIHGHYEMLGFVPDPSLGPGADIWIYGHWPVLLQGLDIGTSSDLCSAYPTSICVNGEWANPGGTAMPGWLVTGPEQAPAPHPLTKISLISREPHGPRIRY